MPGSNSSAGSQSSYASSMGSTSSAAPGADGDRQKNDDRDGDDESSERTQGWMYNVFSALYLAQPPHDAPPSIKCSLASMVVQVLQLLYLMLNVQNGVLAPDKSLWLYKYTVWPLFREPLVRSGSYSMHMALVYVLLAVLCTLTGLIAWMTFVICSDEQERQRHKRLLATVRLAVGLLLVVFPVAMLDMLSTVFTCSWEEWPHPKLLLWPSSPARMCLSGTHLVHAAAAGITFLMLATMFVMMAMATCQQNPLSLHVYAGPNIAAQLKLALIKVAIVLVAGQFMSQRRWQAGLLLALCAWALWISLRQAPLYRPWSNHVHCGVWTAMSFIACVAIAHTHMQLPGLSYTDQAHKMAWWVGVLIIPAGLVGVCLSQLRHWSIHKDLAKVAGAPVGAKPSKVLRLQGVWHVELLTRCVRDKLDHKTGKVDTDSLELAESVLQFAKAKYGKDHASLAILHASFSIHVHRDCQRARMQLQQVQRNNMGIMERYGQHCCTEYIQAAKGAGEGLDLASYVEWNRNYRLAVLAHRSVLHAQRAFWRALINDRIHYCDLAAVLRNMGEAERRAAQIYRRMVERYPRNAKMLKAYARFLEDVQHDPWRANRYYVEADKHGSSDTSSNLAMLAKSVDGSLGIPGMEIDETNTGIIIINADGIVMALNHFAGALFGYTRNEMEGHDIAMIVPPPHNQRHHSYLQRYITTEQPKIVGKGKQQIVGIHKDRSVVPIDLAICRLSGTGVDSVFLGTVNAAMHDDQGLPLYALPDSGTVLCVDPRFPDHFGHSESDYTGKPLGTFILESEEFQCFLSKCSVASHEEREAGGDKFHIRCHFLHKHLEPLPIEVTVMSAGSQLSTWLKLSLHRETPPLPHVVLDQRLSVVAATNDFAALLGYDRKQLLGMSLADMIPPPWSQMHSKWIHDMPVKPPGQSCRSGMAVSLQGKSGVLVPVELNITTKEAAEGLRYVVEATRTSTKRGLDQRRMLIAVDRTTGCITDVPQSQYSKGVFGFDGQLLLGMDVTQVVDAFQLWETSNGPGTSVILLETLANSANIIPGESWRVGVKPVRPQASSGSRSDMTAHADATATRKGDWSSLLRGKQTAHGTDAGIVPACLQVVAEGADVDSEVAVRRVCLALWRADTLSGVMEVDESLRIVKANEHAGIILGRSASELVKQNLRRHLLLPGALRLPDLLNTSSTKGGIKKHGAAWSVGKPTEYSSKHRDEQPLQVQLQVVGKDGVRCRRAMLYIRAAQLSTANLDVFTTLATKPCVSDTDDVGSDKTGVCCAPKGLGAIQAAAGRGGPSAGGAGAAAAHGGRSYREASSSVAHDTGGRGRARHSAVGAGGGGGGGGGVHLHSEYGGAVDDNAAAEMAMQLCDNGSISMDGSGAGSEGEEPEVPHGAHEQQGGHVRQPGHASGRAGGLRQAASLVAGRGAGAGRGGARPGIGESYHNEEDCARSGVPGGQIGSSDCSEGDEVGLLRGGSRRQGAGGGASSAATPRNRNAPPSTRHGGLGSVHARSRGAAENDDDGYGDDDGGSDGNGAAAGGDGMVAVAFAKQRSAAAQPRKTATTALTRQESVGSEGGDPYGAAAGGGEDGLADGDGASSIGDSVGDGAESSVGGGADRDQELHADARRAKRLKKLQAMMASESAQTTRVRFFRHTWGMLLALIAVHVVAFKLFHFEMERQHTYLQDVEEMAANFDHVSLLAVRAFVLSECKDPTKQHYMLCDPTVLETRLLQPVLRSVNQLRRGHRGVYLGWNGLRPLDTPELYSLWTDTNTVEHMYYDVAPEPVHVLSNHSLWRIGNNMIAAGAQVVYEVLHSNATLHTSRHYHYVLDQASESVYVRYAQSFDYMILRAYERLSAINTLLTVLIVVEAFGVMLVIIGYLWRLARIMTVHHMLLFTTFLALPSALLRSMAARPCVVDDEDVEESDEDEDFNAQMEASRHNASTSHGDPAGSMSMAAPGASKQVRMTAPEGKSERSLQGAGSLASAKTAISSKKSMDHRLWTLVKILLKAWRGTSHRAFKVAGRRLIPSRGMEAKFMWLFVLFQLLMVIVYGISFARLAGLDAPVSQVNAILRVLAQSSRTRYEAARLAFASSPEERQEFRPHVRSSCEMLQHEYDIMLYGGVLERLTEELESKFQYPAPPVVFNNRKTAKLLFGDNQCLLADKTLCLPPSHPYSAVTHNGLHSIISRFLQECELLTSDPDESINPDSSRYDFMWRVGGRDMYEGLNKLAHTITDSTIAAYGVMDVLHIILLVIAIIVPCAHVMLIFRPLLARTDWEVFKLTGLLSHLPAEVDVESRLRAAIMHNQPTSNGSGGVGVSGANDVSDANAEAIDGGQQAHMHVLAFEAGSEDGDARHFSANK